ncbi:hypothetical protein [Jeongeupia chitinilytica]|uniref:Uncharacterized protein n=1 Tax=Jeongeupia chitinilytica TaxID=1041641 RepID=A0ABQ3H1G2_9NEIS|nr:hypothetical protein [Jeongeupia chitinilytica]GHD62813.1 hypothetical protein GCM10007350_19080 [Jeongeupia chitinilytica]
MNAHELQSRLPPAACPDMVTLETLVRAEYAFLAARLLTKGDDTRAMWLVSLSSILHPGDTAGPACREGQR